MDQSDPAPPSDHESDWETADDEPPDASRHRSEGSATPPPALLPPLPGADPAPARTFASGTLLRRGAISVPGTHDTLLDTIVHPVPVVRGRPATPPPPPPAPRPRRAPPPPPRGAGAQDPDEAVLFHAAAQRWITRRGQRLWAFLVARRIAVFRISIIFVCVIVPVLLVLYFSNPENRPDISWEEWLDVCRLLVKILVGGFGSPLLVRKGSAAFVELASPYEEFRRLRNNRYALLLAEWIPYFAITPLSNFGIRVALGPWSLCKSNNQLAKYFPIKKRSDLKAVLDILSKYTSSNFQMSMGARSLMDLKPTIGQILAVGFSSCVFALLEALKGPVWVKDTLWLVCFPILVACLALRIAATCHRLGRVDAEFDWAYGAGLVIYTWLISLAWEHRDDKPTKEC